MVELGTGTLGWNANERCTDRYGAVHLNYGERAASRFKDAPLGTVGVMTAEILEVRHLYGIQKSNPPRVGEVVELGVGELFADTYPGVVAIGVKPSDGREDEWLNQKALYRCDGHVVKLVFTPTA
ncbi:hypothetical protein ABT282_07270 [Streptomyces sp. NPDC000927]|uniref:hypothetical protein n=1 Tax=Streptomyces sp. NPDC000927 TaxID=3154371 RepID=UPI00331ECA1C